MSEPLGNISNLTVISTEGASAVTKTVGQVVSEVPKVVKDITGLDLSALLGGVAGGALGENLQQAMSDNAAAKRQPKTPASPDAV